MSGTQKLPGEHTAESVLSVLAMIRQDAVDDIAELEGKPLDGRVVAEAFGKTLAMIDALAGVLTWLVQRQEATSDDPYEPVCSTCGGDGVVLVWSGRTNDRQPCPDCVMLGVAR